MLDKYTAAVEIMKFSGKHANCDPSSWTFQWYTRWTEGYQALEYEKSTEYREDYISKYCS